jgi:hypothetical protein
LTTTVALVAGLGQAEAAFDPPCYDLAMRQRRLGRPASNRSDCIPIMTPTAHRAAIFPGTAGTAGGGPCGRKPL